MEDKDKVSPEKELPEEVMDQLQEAFDNASDPEFQDDEPTVEKIDAPAFKMTRDKMVKAISRAKDKGDLTSDQVRRMFDNMGISQAYFTRSSPNKAQRRARRKMQKRSRQINRGVNKGQKQSGGRTTGK